MLSPARARAQLVALDRFQANQSLVNFVPLAWPELEPAARYVPGWQVEAVCEHLEAVTYGWVNRLLINVPPGSMKALDSDTPVLTLDGWVRHGDLQPGDFVYGADGTPKRVLGCTAEVVEDAYEVAFDNGASVVAGGAHLWAVERRCYGRTPQGWRFYRELVVVPTGDLRFESDATGKTKRPDRIRVADAFWAPRRSYLIDPYVLGAWLGDGSSNSGHIYSADQDFAHFAYLAQKSRAYPADGTRKQDFHRLLIEDLQTKLRVLGLLGNKHVPEDYLRGAYADRLALLQGLMDTDGTVANGLCTFINKNKLLANAVQFLATSIGAKAYATSRYTELNGAKYGPHYMVTFLPPVGVAAFRLERKQVKVRQSVKDRTFSMYVAGVTPVGARRVKCIQVEGGVYLAGRALVPTHNSLLSSVMWPAWEWGPRDRAATRYLATAFNDGPVKRDTRKMRDLVASEWYQQRWPHVKLVRSGETSFANSQTGSREGVPFPSLTSQRGDRLIIDDPHSTTTAESETERKRTVRQFREGAVNRLNDQERSAIVVIMQRLHEGDISGEILANNMGYVHLCLPMEYEPKPYKIGGHTFDPKKPNGIQFTDPRTVPGELLNPDRFSPKIVADLQRDLGEYAYTGQYQQRPVPREGGLFKRQWFEGRIIGAAPPGTVWVRHWDLAASRGKGAYTAGVKLGRTPDGRYVVGHVNRFREEGDVVRKNIRLQGQLDTAATTISVPQDGGQAGKVQKQEMLAYLAGFTVRVLLEASLGDKQARAEPFAVQCEAGNVSLVRGDWNEDYLNELCLFPGGKYKDQVDATSGAFAQHVMRPAQTVVGVQRKGR